MGKVNGLIANVRNYTKDGVVKVLVTFSNGDQFHPTQAYIDSVLKSQELEGAPNNTLVGTQVSYNKVMHKEGEQVTNFVRGQAERVIVPGKFYTKDGYNPEELEIIELGEKAERFQMLYSKEIQKQKAKNKLAGKFSGMMAKAASYTITPDGITKQDETPVEEPADATTEDTL